MRHKTPDQRTLLCSSVPDEVLSHVCAIRAKRAGSEPHGLLGQKQVGQHSWVRSKPSWPHQSAKEEQRGSGAQGQEGSRVQPKRQEGAARLIDTVDVDDGLVDDAEVGDVDVGLVDQLLRSLLEAVPPDVCLGSPSRRRTHSAARRQEWQRH